MLFDLVMVSAYVTRCRERWFGFGATQDRTLFLNSVDGSKIALNYAKFTYDNHPVFRTAIIAMDRPRSGEKYCQVYCVSGIASQIAVELGECRIPRAALRDHMVYVLAARAVVGPLPPGIPVF